MQLPGCPRLLAREFRALYASPAEHELIISLLTTSVQALLPPGLRRQPATTYPEPEARQLIHVCVNAKTAIVSGGAGSDPSMKP